MYLFIKEVAETTAADEVDTLHTAFLWIGHNNLYILQHVGDYRDSESDEGYEFRYGLISG